MTTQTENLMTDELQQLVSLANMAHDETDPVERLQLLTAVSDSADRALGLAVPVARNTGTTWERLSTALGVSRQAAHERYSRQRAVSTK